MLYAFYKVGYRLTYLQTDRANTRGPSGPNKLKIPEGSREFKKELESFRGSLKQSLKEV